MEAQERTKNLLLKKKERDEENNFRINLTKLDLLNSKITHNATIKMAAP